MNGYYPTIYQARAAAEHDEGAHVGGKTDRSALCPHCVNAATVLSLADEWANRDDWGVKSVYTSVLRDIVLQVVRGDYTIAEQFARAGRTSEEFKQWQDTFGYSEVSGVRCD